MNVFEKLFGKNEDKMKNDSQKSGSAIEEVENSRSRSGSQKPRGSNTVAAAAAAAVVGGGNSSAAPSPANSNSADDDLVNSSKKSGAGNEVEDKRQKYVINKEEFNVDVRYKPIKKLGSGAYGMVVSATDEQNAGKKIAIKKVREVFHNLTDAKRILREIKLMQHFDHPNVMGLQDMINPVTKGDFEDLYLVMEYMQSDLHRIIYSDNELSEDHIAYVIYQIFCGLKHIHSAQVMHRDLKPGNILINADCKVKICDLGLARGVARNINVAPAAENGGSASAEEKDAMEEEQLWTEYVVTRWYRAPEIMVAAQKYGYGIDVWSVGCIMAELLNREPIFQGENYVDQLKVIFSTLGTPSEEDYECITSPEALQFVKKQKKKEGTPFEKLFPNASAEARDLLSKIFVFNPNKRISVDDALKHPFMKKFYNEDFITKSVNGTPFDFEFEKFTRTKENLQDQMFMEIIKFRPWAAKKNPMAPDRRGSNRTVIKHRRSITDANI